jgi:hypothetical protein
MGIPLCASKENALYCTSKKNGIVEKDIKYSLLCPQEVIDWGVIITKSSIWYKSLSYNSFLLGVKFLLKNPLSSVTGNVHELFKLSLSPKSLR